MSEREKDHAAGFNILSCSMCNSGMSLSFLSEIVLTQDKLYIEADLNR